jgi:hypothetical protein
MKRINHYEINCDNVLSTILSGQPIEERSSLRKINQKGIIKVIDLANVAMIVAKTPLAKTILWKYTTKQKTESKKTRLDYKTKKLNEIRSHFSMEYLKKMLPLFEIADDEDEGGDRVTFWLKRDYPLMMENKHWQAILAPRVNECE